MQNVRRTIVERVLNECEVDQANIQALDKALQELTDSRTSGEMRYIATPTANFPINIRDEIRGLRLPSAAPDHFVALGCRYIVQLSSRHATRILRKWLSFLTRSCNDAGTACGRAERQL
ncbi:unnamed protein product [Strongylus vulgaris]|uniref:Trehalose-6-phosphate phosphatase helical bundle domain-containing protein n=1 Tax=Strongylus vulgaris TaxID=40348 RepID=A0A3P7J3Q0_STRVU|nr:unnamed protein product [Strongylus vulgaris]